MIERTKRHLIPSFVRFPFRRAAALLPFLPMSLVAAGLGGSNYQMMPKVAEPNQAFAMMLESPDFTCATQFTHQAVAVSDHRIDVSFVANDSGNVRCASPAPINGPAFHIDSLKAGTYAVYASRNLDCMYGAIRCLIAIQPVFVDSLKVASGSVPMQGKWFLQPNHVAAGPSNRILLLNWNYGSCQNGFSNISLNPSGGGFAIRLAVQMYKRLCVDAVKPYGVALDLNDLQPGRYPIFVHELTGCELDQPPCYPPIAYEPPVDTLVVTSATDVKTARGAAAFPIAQLRGNQLRVTFPGDFPGPWKIDLLTVSGKRLQSYRVTEAVEGSAQFRWPANVREGVYLLRLRSAEGEICKLRVVR